jgi:hypothetical protein
LWFKRRDRLKQPGDLIYIGPIFPLNIKDIQAARATMFS